MTATMNSIIQEKFQWFSMVTTQTILESEIITSKNDLFEAMSVTSYN